MIESPQVVETEKRLTAVIRLKVPSVKIREFMGPGLQELRATVAAQGVEVTGPWFTHHFKRPGEFFDFEICVPVASAVRAEGRVVPGEWPAMKVLRTVYHGPYEGLGAGWGEFLAWISTSGHTPALDLWECYSVGPESGPDASAYRTELNQPLAAQ
jgi:effector-binding domain-containing protein